MSRQTRNPRITRFPRWAMIVFGVALLVGIGAGIFLAFYAKPYLHQKAEDVLSSRFHGDVDIQSFSVSLFPLTLQGSGIVLRHHGRTDVPPLIEIHDFSASASLWNIFGKPWHIKKVQITGLAIHVPPKDKRGKLMSSSSKKPHDVPVKIDELIAENTELDILPGKPEKSPHQFIIHHLEMHGISPNQGAPFEATLTNATPPGEIHVKGKFGPWQADEPRTTPVSANYTFDHADLSVFKGIAGMLSSTGKFGGPLEQLEVEGETTTPDFTVSSGGHPMMLKTEFKATVDGTNGDTLLHPVVAHFLNTTLVCNGGVVKPEDGKHGKEVILDVVSDDGRLEDFLRMAVKADKPPLTGAMNLKTKFDLPPGEGDVVDKLKLDGKFGVGNAQFTNAEVRDKLQNLSRRGQGHPKDEDAGSAVSQFKGDFKLNHGIASFRNLSFHVTGATVNLNGDFGLRSEKLDFHGHLRLDAKLSQTTTGVKSFFLKVFDPFFRKDGKTSIPIKVTGTREKPSFGLDFGHHDDDEKNKETAKKRD